jgi:hypothetical protein
MGEPVAVPSGVASSCRGRNGPDGPPGMSVSRRTTCTNRQLPETRVLFSPCFLVLAAGRTPVPRAATEHTPMTTSFCRRPAGSSGWADGRPRSICIATLFAWALSVIRRKPQCGRARTLRGIMPAATPENAYGNSKLPATLCPRRRAFWFDHFLEIRYRRETAGRSLWSLALASVAQLDRASVFGTDGWGFKSLRTRSKTVFSASILRCCSGRPPSRESRPSPSSRAKPLAHASAVRDRENRPISGLYLDTRRRCLLIGAG